MGTPQTIVNGLPFHAASCQGLLICDQSVASIKSCAYLMELVEPSHFDAASMPLGSNFPSYIPRPAPKAAPDAADCIDLPELVQLVVARALTLPDDPPQAVARPSRPTTARANRIRVLVAARRKGAISKIGRLYRFWREEK